MNRHRAIANARELANTLNEDYLIIAPPYDPQAVSCCRKAYFEDRNARLGSFTGYKILAVVKPRNS